jgi:PEP-CTERM motif
MMRYVSFVRPVFSSLSSKARVLVVAAITVLALTTSVRTAIAGPFALGTVVGANVGCVPGKGAQPVTGTPCPNIDGDEDSSLELTGNGGLLSLTDATDGIADPDFQYSAAAAASFGSLHARASGSYDLSSEGYRGASASAFATDLLTLSAPGLNGQAGTLDVSFLLDGTLQTSGGGGAAVFTAVTWGGNSADPFDVPPGDLAVFDGGTVPSGPACNNGDINIAPATGSGSGSADFFNTMTLSGLLPIDANGNPVLNAQFSSTSGTTYSINGVVATPEPASVVLLGTGLAAWVGLRRRRRQ